ncbi:50S ribosomal protein L21, mitochondrial-like [Iris pallida]|uniref:Large ribosomal subunit protein bL21m n=1 Tax=Iris pallida TaxID=29817 RepID=A0AAX6G3C1_IRIPA|nr:50S ribosomal protein L21, mitochondrial-like [Iris pallida]
MASQRRIGTLVRHFRPFLFSNHSLNSSQTLTLPILHPPALENPNPNTRNWFIYPLGSFSTRRFSSRPPETSGEDEDDDDDDDDEGEGEVEEDDDDGESCNGTVTKYRVSGKSEEEKISEAAEIGYRVIGPLDPTEKPFKPWEPAFAVVQIGSHQFKVSNGDSIFTERLKFCDVNDKLILNKVLMLGSRAETIIGRPVLPDAAVHAVVEEHALDAKVIIFKKKRRKNYRRTKGHRQELTKLRITDIQGIEKSESVAVAA